MKSSFAILFLLFISTISCSTNSQAQNSELPKALQDLPIGIEVRHSKDTVYAEINDQNPEKRGAYMWHYETSVKSINEDLTIVEFGAYVMRNNAWQLTSIYGRPFNVEEFEKWYSCADGLLTKGKEFTDFNNWAKGNKLDGETQNGLWYYIGVNENGEKFVGTAEITTVHSFREE